MALYAERINAHRFALVAPLIAPDAVFWFSDGSHKGIDAIERAFAATWATLHDEAYWLEDRRWLTRDGASAVCLYRFCWTASIDGTARSGGGRGTSVLERRSDGWVIVHEHLSATPAQACLTAGPAVGAVCNSSPQS
ncbi:MAG: YybH family protein [Devosia sp.]